MNPYASWLADRDPFAVIRETGSRVTGAIRAAADLDAPWAPGKWSRRQVLAHMADTEIVFAMRLRQTIAEEHHIIQPFDQDAWAKTYTTADAEAALATFVTVRKWNLLFLSGVPEAELLHPVSHPERGAMTFRTLVETMAGHDLNHLSQLEAN